MYHEFVLSLGCQIIGILEYKDGKWQFFYSDSFKSNNIQTRPIIPFPDVGLVYRSNRLWPFFELRIPSVKQPHIKNITKKEGIDPNDRVAMLKRFGRHVVHNPYILTFVR